MAHVDYETFMSYNKKERESNSTNQKFSRPYVRYFGLRDDGDTAIVRFNITSLEDDSLAVQSIHRFRTKEGKLKVIGCLRSDPTESFDKCPLCSDDMKPQFRIFIQLLDYQQDENGNTIAVPSTWDQPARMRETLKSYLMEYGDLRDYVFKIVRQGKKGDTQVKYSIIPCNQNIYKEDIFKKDFSAFDTFNMTSRVMNLSYDDIKYLVENGEIPQATPKSDVKDPSPVVEQKLPEEPKVEPTTSQNPVITNPLRSGQPLRSTYQGVQNNTGSAKPSTRRYTY